MVYFIPVPVYWHLFAMLDSNTTKYARTYNVRFIFHAKLDIHPKSRRPQRQRITWE